MSARRIFVAAGLVAGLLAGLPAAARQQPPEPPTAPAAVMSPAEIKQAVEKIKKGRTLVLSPAAGIVDQDGATVLRFENASAFDLVVLLVGPTTQRVELGPNRMQTLDVQPGPYEIAVTVVGRDIPPFYGTEQVEKSMHFLHQFVVPAV